jgi:hypothetical protein
MSMIYKATLAFRTKHGLVDLTRTFMATTKQALFDDMEYFIEDQVDGYAIAASYFRQNSSGNYAKFAGWRK